MFVRYLKTAAYLYHGIFAVGELYTFFSLKIQYLTPDGSGRTIPTLTSTELMMVDEERELPVSTEPTRALHSARFFNIEAEMFSLSEVDDRADDWPDEL